MRIILLTIACFFVFVANLAIADGFETYESSCKEIGFKPKTPDFGDCVLELRKRDLSKKTIKVPQTSTSRPSSTKDTYSAPAQNNNAEFEAQANEHFRQQQALYDQQMALYQKQQADYEAQKVAIERAKEERRNMKLMELGLRMAGGQSIQDASMATAGMQPLPTPRPPSMQMQENYRITTPNGGLVNCRYDPNIRSATCY